MTSRKRTARIAGLWYLGFTLGPFYLLYVPSQTIVNNNAAANRNPSPQPRDALPLGHACRDARRGHLHRLEPGALSTL
jgi:hypothetical protein